MIYLKQGILCPDIFFSPWIVNYEKYVEKMKKWERPPEFSGGQMPMKLTFLSFCLFFGRCGWKSRVYPCCGSSWSAPQWDAEGPYFHSSLLLFRPINVHMLHAIYPLRIRQAVQKYMEICALHISFFHSCHVAKLVIDLQAQKFHTTAYVAYC